MPRRGENIRKRADGRWEARYKDRIDHSGHTKYRSIYAKTYKEVKEKLQLVKTPDFEGRSASKDADFRTILQAWFSVECASLKNSTKMNDRTAYCAGSGRSQGHSTQRRPAG